MGVCIMDDFFKANDDKFTYSQNTSKTLRYCWYYFL